MERCRLGLGKQPSEVGRKAPHLARRPGRSRFPLERAACAGAVARRIEEMAFSPGTLAPRAGVAEGEISLDMKKVAPASENDL